MERIFSVDAIKQMGGYIKRCYIIQVKVRIVNPKGHRIQQIYFGDEPLVRSKIYKTVFVINQAVSEGLGSKKAKFIHQSG